MSTEVYQRKATFKVAKVKGQRVFTPVNRRAHIVAKKLGKRSKISVAELKSSLGKGSYTFWFYNDSGVLKPVKF